MNKLNNKNMKTKEMKTKEIKNPIGDVNILSSKSSGITTPSVVVDKQDAMLVELINLNKKIDMFLNLMINKDKDKSSKKSIKSLVKNKKSK